MKENNRILFTILSALVIVASIFTVAISTDEAPNSQGPEDGFDGDGGEINYPINENENGLVGIHENPDGILKVLPDHSRMIGPIRSVNG
jgi:hypothetical protein